MSEKTLNVKTGVKSRVVKVDQLARVEGEGALYIKTNGDKVETVQLKIFEPPRFFEAFLKGRGFTEAPDITARICGICPVAYQMSSVHAMENALGITVPEPIRQFRRLLYCGEWIESHALHVLMLHAPDFLGYADAMEMARDHRELVEKGLQFKKAGNEIVTVVGGREIHPINVRVGGFYRAPERTRLHTLCENLKRVRDVAETVTRWTATLDFPELDLDYEFVSLFHPTEYPMNEGRIISNRGLDIEVGKYEDHFEEEHVAYTNALHSVLKERGQYFVGPMARFNLCFDKLPSHLQSLAKEVGLETPCTNPYRSITIRSLEMLFACEEAIRILESGEVPEPSFIPVEPKKSRGCAATEAPRGLLYHRYELNDDGSIELAKIVPPTSQNQKTIESDLRRVVELSPSLSQEDLTWRCEQTIRNYDPCISCATHFLRIEVQRDNP